MLGWEFPPQFSGGLGVACQGLSQAMSKITDIDLTLVLPKKMIVDQTTDFFYSNNPIRTSCFISKNESGRYLINDHFFGQY
jgi:hypothetical protein